MYDIYLEYISKRGVLKTVPAKASSTLFVAVYEEFKLSHGCRLLVHTSLLELMRGQVSINILL
jgi:hypothetical protein